MKLILPAVFSVDEIRADNRIRHIAEPATPSQNQKIFPLRFHDQLSATWTRMRRALT